KRNFSPAPSSISMAPRTCGEGEGRRQKIGSFSSPFYLLPSTLLSVIVSARAVHVAVFLFLGSGVADFRDFHVEVQDLAGQRVVAVDLHALVADFAHG